MMEVGRAGKPGGVRWGLPFTGKWDSDAGEIALPLTTTGVGIFTATQESKKPTGRPEFEERLDGCDGEGGGGEGREKP